MKLKNEDHVDSPDWVETIVRTHLTTTTQEATDEKSAAEFRARCRATALASLDALKMRRQRLVGNNIPGSLQHYLEACAQLAGVRLSGLLAVLGITDVEGRDSKSARGLAMLARQLGLAREEVILRLRVGFAQLTTASLAGYWTGEMQPARARRTPGTRANSSALAQILRRRESGYGPSRRAALRNALNAVAEAYGMD